MSTANPFDLNELYQHALEQFESALKTGVRIQEESIKLLTTWANEPPLMQAQKAQAAMLQTLSSMPEHIHEAMDVMNDQAKNAMNLLQQAFEVSRSNNVTEVQEKTHRLWETTLGIMRTNVHSLLKAHATMMQKWENMAGAVGGNQHD